MPAKTIGVREEVYERLRARKRDGESFTDLIDRLIDESEDDWRAGFGSLSAEETESLREAAAASRERFDESAANRQTAAIDRLAGASSGGEQSSGAELYRADDHTRRAVDAAAADLLIAGVADAEGMTVVTRNVADFEPFVAVASY